MRAVILAAVVSLAFVVSARTVESINHDWKYDGRSVDLPHDAMFEFPWDKNANHSQNVFKPVGEARYEKDFPWRDEWEGKRVLLDFGGLMFYGEVTVNGVKLAEPQYGYLGFEVDVTAALRRGGMNKVEVWSKVNSGGDWSSSRWYTGLGLYRGVDLVVLDREVRIARHGVQIITRENRFVDVTVETEGLTRTDDDWLVKASVAGTDICISVPVPKDDGRVRVPTKFTMELPNAKLWSCESPNLYSLKVGLVKDGVIRDSVTERFGVRTIEFAPEFGFKLNGKKVFLKGQANHGDLGALGVAAFPDAIRRYFKTMKSFGYNSVRCSHNPYSKEFYDLADELGIIVVDEFADKWCGYWAGRGKPLDFWPELITEWVRANRNHPSIVLWSLGNEMQQRIELTGYPTDDWGITTYKILDVMVKRWDPTRKTTVAMFPSRANGVYRKHRDNKYFAHPRNPPELVSATDVASFNYRWEDYDEYRRNCPKDLIVFQSEAGTRELLAAYFGMDRARDVGLCYWGATEYWGESNRWPKKGWNYSFFSHTLRPYPQAWLIKSGFIRDTPICRIGISEGGEQVWWNDVLSGIRKLRENWNRAKGSKAEVSVFSNAPEVELFLNGRSLGKKRNVLPPEGDGAWQCEAGKQIHTVSYQLDYEPGELVAKASNGAVHSVLTTGPAVELRVRKEPDEDNKELVFYWIEAFDSQGRFVPDAKCEVKVSVTGDAKLLALDDGDHYTELPANVDCKKMKEGYLLAIVRKGCKCGNHEVTAVRIADLKGPQL